LPEPSRTPEEIARARSVLREFEDKSRRRETAEGGRRGGR
jgi:hypothetical protein